jgi:UDP-N-acetylmuramoyl-tripeptide--D-alanyl-D-alanine ligase
MLWTAQDAAAATDGKITSNWEAFGVSIDTRSIQRGDLFVALKDIRDGHDFVAQAFEKGATAALVSRIPEGVSSDKLLIVDDVLTALEGLSRASRARFQGKVVGVTGSVGKTSTKEMLRHVLGVQGKVHAAEKSFNNHWGVPLTLARMPEDAEYAVIEIGMNHPGEIAPLAKLAQPDVAVITIVAPAHLEAFENVQGIAREKAAIFEGLTKNGTAIINGDLEVTDILQDLAGGRAQTFGTSDTADWHLIDAVTADDCVACQACHDDQTILFKVGAPGGHFAMNGLASLAVVDAVGADLARAAIALADWHPPAGRGQRHFVRLDPARPEVGIDLFDDAYNANPASVGAALNVIASAMPPGPKGQRVVLLGDMKELGPTEIQLHVGLVDHPAMDSIDQVHCVGPLMRHLHEALPADKRGEWSATSAELAAQARNLVQAGDVVMAKGSLSMKMALIVDAVRKLGQSVEDD